MNPFVESNLTVAIAKLRAARTLMEDNATLAIATQLVAEGCGRDAAALRNVYSLVLDALGPVAGALAVLRSEDERLALEKAKTEPPPQLRIVK